MDIRAEASAIADLLTEGAPGARARFIAFRTALVQRGLHDPVLMRYDSHTVTRADDAMVAAQLRLLAGLVES